MNLYCWAHVRRYFVRAGDANPDQLSGWTAAWLERIKNLYAAHEQLEHRMGRRVPPPNWSTHARPGMTRWASSTPSAPSRWPRPGCRNRRRRPWPRWTGNGTGWSAHRDYPMISLDNNAAERALRRPVVTRKNAYGSRNEDAARLAARIWTITATAEMAGLNLHHLPHRLPRRLRTNRRQTTRPAPTWNGSCPGPRPAKTYTPGHSHPAPADTPSPRHGVTAEKRSRRSPACPPRDFRILTR